MRRYAGRILTATILLLAGLLHADARFPGSDPPTFVIELPSLAPAVQTVTALATGPDGFLWVGTPFGLVRWDGYETTTFTAGEAGLADDDITVLHLDGGGDLFVGTSHAGLLRLDAEAERFERLPQPSAGAITAIAHDSRNRLWVGTADSGVFVLDPGRGEFTVVTHDPLLPVSLSSPEVTTLVVDARDRVYVATLDRGLTVLEADLSRATVHRRLLGSADGLPSDALTALLPRADGELWAGTASGELGRYDPAARRWRPALPPPGGSDSAAPGAQRDPLGVADDASARALTRAPVRALFEDSHGRLWVGRDGAPTLRVEPDQPPVAVRCADHAVAFDEDAAGVIRAGTHASGVRRHLPHAAQFSTYGAGGCGTAGGPTVWSLREWNGRIVAASSIDGTVVVDPTSGDATAAPGGRALPAGFGMVVRAEPVDGGVWYLSSVGRALLVDAAGQVVRGLQPGEQALSIARAGEDVWIGTARSGVISVAPDGTRRAYGTGGAVFAIAPDRAGALWLGTEGALLRLDPGSGTIERYPIPPADRPGGAGVAGGDRVLSIEGRPDGLVWVAARESGVLLFDRQGGVRRRLEPRTDFEADLAYAIAGDGQGGLWFTTNRGLFRLDERRGVIDAYGVADGLSASEFNADALLRAADGTMWAGTVNGMVRFDPVTVTPAGDDPVVTISRAVLLPGGEPVRGRAAESGRSYVVPAGSHGLTLHASVTRVVDPSAVRYEYRLIDTDGTMVDSVDGRVATLAELEPGAYRLVVEVSLPGRAAASGAFAAGIEVVPAFRQTAWMPALAVAVALLVIVLVRAGWRSTIRGYERRLEAAERQHARDVASRRLTASPLDEVSTVRESRTEADGDDRLAPFE